MCQHKHTYKTIRGELYFGNGEIVDTLREVDVCLNCGAVVEVDPEPEPEPVLMLAEIDF